MLEMMVDVSAELAASVLAASASQAARLATCLFFLFLLCRFRWSSRPSRVKFHNSFDGVVSGAQEVDSDYYQLSPTSVLLLSNLPLDEFVATRPPIGRVSPPKEYSGYPDMWWETR